MRPGDRFGQLVVIGATDRRAKSGERWYAYRCDCGTITSSTPSYVASGRRTSCADCARPADTGEDIESTAYARTLHMQHEAHVIYRKAIRDGVITPRAECERCGREGDASARSGGIVGHHEDYSKPLDVVWLCHSCHACRHVELGSRYLGHMRRVHSAASEAAA